MEIWKYKLSVVYAQEIRIPEGATYLSIIEQDDLPCVYFLVDRERPKAKVTFRIVGTGEHINEQLLYSLTKYPKGMGSISYLGTVSTMGGRAIWHIFVLCDDGYSLMEWPIRHLSPGISGI